MAVGSVLYIANTGLKAARMALQTVSHNIANANTVGYARQEAILEEAMPVPTSMGFLGNGVMVKTVERHFDQFLQNQINSRTTDAGQQQVLSDYMQSIESILNEDKSKLGASTLEFFNGWQDLSLDPGNGSLKDALVQKGETMTYTVRSIYQNLNALQTGANEKIAQDVDDINGLASGIADLNQLIFSSGMGTQEANDYMNQKDRLVGELSRKIDVSTVQDEFGRTTVILKNGNPLVDKGTVWELGTRTDAGGMYDITWTDPAGNTAVITDQIGGGEIKGLLTIRDETVPDFVAQMDDYAKTLMGQVNTLHKAGYDELTGTTGTAFFKELTGNYAADFDLSDAVKADSGHVVTHTDSLTTTGNDVALAIADLADAKIFEGGTKTFGEVTSAITSKVGRMKRTADDMSTYYNDMLAMLNTQRDSISGVSLDEEMANLMKFQQAFQAASRLFTVADEMLQELMNMVR
jgi:flagellar hook-associated protein 1 FlgK